MKKLLSPRTWYVIGFVLVLAMAFGRLPPFSSYLIAALRQTILALEPGTIVSHQRGLHMMRSTTHTGPLTE